MKSILLHTADDALFNGRLQAALDLARFMNGHLECLQTRRIPSYLGADIAGFAGSASMVVQLIDEENRAVEENRQKLKSRLAKEDIAFSFSDAMGDVADSLVSHSLLADVIVMSLADQDHRDLLSALASTVTMADAPVLAIPTEMKRLPLEKPVLVAWKPTAEAAHAVKRSIPVLQKASRVDVLTVDQEQSVDFPHTAVGNYLSRHGVNAVLHERASEKKSTSEIIVETANELGSGLIVMGGYGRSRAMEFLLGGVTRRLLHSSPFPLLMAH